MATALTGEILKETKRFIDKQGANAETIVSKDSIKFHLDGKFVLATYVRNNIVNFLFSLEKEDCERVEAIKDDIPYDIYEIYMKTPEYHNRKWLMIPVYNLDRLVAVKRMIRAKALQEYRRNREAEIF